MDYSMKVLPISFFLILVLTATPVLALNGWTVSNDGNMRLYVPKDLQEGEVFMYMASGPYDLNGADMKGWFSDTSREIQKHLGKPLNEWRVKPDKNNWSTSNQYIDKESGKKLNISYQGGTLDQNRVYIITMLSSSDFALILKYGFAFDKVLNDAKEYFTAQPSVTKSSVTANTSNNTKPAITRVIPPPKGLKEIRGILDYGIQPAGTYGLTGKVVALFDDDSFTHDLGVVFSKGTDRAKKENPKIWGKWRISNKELELKDYEDEEFGKTHGNWVATPGKKDMKLEGCYGNITSSSGAFQTGIIKGQASSWCFNQEGRFAYGATGYGVGIFDVNTSKRGKSKAGYYRIDHYTARFIFDDGTDITTAFCFLDDKNEHISINGNRLMLNY
jgi:hypothetical protein